MSRRTWCIHVTTTRIELSRQQIELLRAVCKPVKQDDRMIYGATVFVESWQRGMFERSIGCVASDYGANGSDGFLVRKRSGDAR